MNNNQNPGRRPMTRAEYERLQAAKARREQLRRERISKRNRIVCGIIAIALLAGIVFTAVQISKKFQYKDPNEVFGNEPPATIPSGVNTDPVTQPTEPLTENKNGRISFIAAGDNIIHEAVFLDAAKRAGGNGYDFTSMYKGLAPLIGAADIAYVNQETVMAGTSYGIKGYPQFNSPQEAGDTLVELGFNAVNIATNHMLDIGTPALKDTITYWQGKDVTLLGAYTESDYNDIRTQTVNGITVAWLSYTYGTNGYTLAEGSDLVIPYIDEGTIRRQAALAKQKGDIVIASMHWGTDSAIKIDDSQKKTAKVLADCGVDVIIGTHSHTLQGVEWITSTDGTHKTLCYYSLGNLINTGYEYYKMVGGLASFDIVKDGAGTRVENAALIPTACHYSMDRDGLQLYELEDYTQSLAEAHGSQKHIPFTYEDMKKLATDAVSAEFLPNYLK